MQARLLPIPLCIAVGYLVVLLAFSSNAFARPSAPPNRAVVRLANEAHAAYQAGDQKRAADLYFRAHQLDPGDGAFLWGSARSLQLDGQLDLAEVRYVAFLQLETADRALREKAVVYLAQVRAALRGRVAPRAEREPEPPTPAPLSVAVTPAVPPVVEVPPTTPIVPSIQAPVASVPPPALSRLRQAMLWGASGAALVGAGLLAVATWERSDFVATMSPGFTGGKVDGYADRAAAVKAGEAIAFRQNLGGVVCALGAVGALTAWFWPRERVDPSVQVLGVPNAGGWTLVAGAPW